MKKVNELQKSNDLLTEDLKKKHPTISETDKLSAKKVGSPSGPTVTNTEFGYLSGVTSSIQDQIAKIIGITPAQAAKIVKNETSIGSLNDLNTTEKDTLVKAINHINTSLSTNATYIGDINNLNTTNKTNLVAAINSLFGSLSSNLGATGTLIGTLTDLSTTAKSDLVAAINEINAALGTNANHIGTITDLSTSQKGNLVAAINSVKSLSDTRFNDLLGKHK